ncbi:MAG TPA: ArsR family transcriptional regulator [Verrucomicrobiales bacterium]|nr:ArsR family transcriptional regulator [Verrucomicrobiales bacterium]
MHPLLLSAKAFSDPTRVRVLAALRSGELCVCELCDALRVTQSTLSTHLQVIRRAGLVRSRREGRWAYYALVPQGRRLVEGWLRHFGSVVARDPRLRADAARLSSRLAKRQGGACCLGFPRGASEKPKGKG